MRNRARRVSLISIIVLIVLVAVAIVSCFGGRSYDDHGTDTEKISKSASTKEVIDFFDGEKLGTVVGTTYATVIKDCFQNSAVIYADRSADMVELLQSQAIEGFVCGNDLLSKEMLAQEDIVCLDAVFEGYDLGIAFPENKRGKALCEAFNAFLQSYRASGGLDSLRGQWIDGSLEVEAFDIDSLEGTNGVLTCAVEATNYPYVYVQDGQLKGFEAALLYQFGKACGYALDIHDMNFTSMMTEVEDGKCDLCAGGISITPEREVDMYFSDPIGHTKTYMVTRAELVQDDEKDEVITLSDLDGKIAGCLTGAPQDQWLSAKINNLQFEYYNAYTDEVLALDAGKIDLLVTTNVLFASTRPDHPDFHMVEESLLALNASFVCPYTPSGDALIKELNAYIADFVSSGKQQEYYDLWIDGYGSHHETVDIPKTGEKGVLNLAVCSTMIPNCYIQDGEYAGYEIAVAADFCRTYGYALRIDDMAFSALIAAVETGKYDFACGNICKTEERAQSVHFADTTLEENVYPVVKLPKKTVGAVVKSFGQRLLESFEKNLIREDRWKLMLKGVGVTCLITLLSAIFGSVLGFLICIYKRTQSAVARVICRLFSWIMAGTPIVVLLMVLYYLVFGNSDLPAIWVAVIGFTLTFGSTVAEILQSGLDAVGAGQREAALALGFGETKTFFKFILPQAVVNIASVYAGAVVTLLKGTSVVGYIAIQDLTKMGDIIRGRTYEAFFPLITTALLYFALVAIVLFAVGRIEHAINPRKHKRGVRGVKSR